MDFAAVVARVETARPRVAAELAKPHAEEALLAGVVTDLLAADALDLIGDALSLPGTVERVALWGADVVSGADDLTVAAALRAAAPGRGRAATLEAEPDLVVVTSTVVAAVDATVTRPGHAAARAARGEPLPPARADEVAEVLARHGAVLPASAVAATFGTARLAAVALELGSVTRRRPVALAVSGHAEDLLHPGRDQLAAWLDAASIVAGATRSALDLRAVSWLQVADRLRSVEAAATAVRRIHRHPLLAPTRRPIA